MTLKELQIGKSAVVVLVVVVAIINQLATLAAPGPCGSIFWIWALFRGRRSL